MTKSPNTPIDEAALLDDHAVDLFAKAMKDKLGIKRNQGFGGWHDIRQSSSMRLADLLLAAVAKGDPVDVANFAMMLFCRHESHEALKGSCAKFCGGRLSAAAPQPAAPVLSGDAINEIMEQAQVFASAWSLVGSRFDSGNELGNAEQQKSDLRALLAKVRT